MARAARLRKAGEFRAVFQAGKSLANRLGVLYVKRTGSDVTRPGFVVGRSAGKAVQRNRIKRVFREAYRLTAKRVRPGFDLVFVARHASKDAGLAEIIRAVVDLLERGGALR